MRIVGMGTPMKGDPCGTCIEIRMKKFGSNYGGHQTPPRRKRRTPDHQKGLPYPGNWSVNNPPKSRRSKA